MVDRPLKVADDRQDGCRHCHRNRNPPARKLRHRPKSGKVPKATASLPQPDRCGRDNREGKVAVAAPAQLDTCDYCDDAESKTCPEQTRD